MSEQPIAPGQTLAGKYKIESVLGAGAMGTVLAATHLVLGSRVAIKIMLGGSKNGPEQEQRFLREARVASRLKSEHAGKVLDVGVTDAGAPYIVMEYLDGQDLGALLKARGPLPVAEAVTYVLQACEALAEAHALGIVHRDIKPANLFLTTSVSGAPCLKVVDFGIAKQIDGATDLTQTGAAVGSPIYMSPEQMKGSREVDGRADIWSLGVTLYQLLAGTPPFYADTIMAVVTLVHLEPPTPLAQHRPDVAPNLAAVILQCLEKSRERRWPSVAAFAAALAPHASAAPASYAERVARVQKADIAPSRPTIELPQAPTAALAAAVRTASPPMSTIEPPRHLLMVAISAVVLVATLGIAVFFGLRARGGSTGTTTIPSARGEVSAMAGPTAGEVALPAITDTTTAIIPPTSPVAPIASATPTASPPHLAATHAPTAPRPAGTWGGARR